VSFWASLANELWDTWSFVLFAAYLLTRFFVQISPRPIERYHMRAAGTLIFGHLVALTIGVGQHHYGYEGRIAEITSFAFESLCVLLMTITGVFRALLPRVNIVLPRILLDLMTAIGVIFVFIAIGRRAGFSVAGLITTSAVLTAVIGFSLQDTLGNMMGGLSVQMDKSIAVGDWITVNNIHGRVTEIRWRYTAIEMRNWDTAIIPNGTLVKSQVVIMGRRQGMPDMQRRHIDFFVDFRSAPTTVIDAVLSALRSDPVTHMAKEPGPQVLFMGVRDSYAHYQARYWLDDLGVDDPTDSAVRTRIWFSLRRAGISMSIPASSVFLTHETPEREQRKAERELEQRMRAIARVDLFDNVTSEQKVDLAEHLQFTPFAMGEAITREGDKDDGLYMIVEGTAVVRIGKGRDQREVARLGPGQFFGEMSLMTGEARTATVVAATDLVTYRMSKPAFQAVLEKAPEILEEVAEVLAQRKSELSAARDEHSADRATRMETTKRDLSSRIRGFFGLDAAR
jgi:small-conductance mechanosensitive channel/CRP-like cAMP-binding protein